MDYRSTGAELTLRRSRACRSPPVSLCRGLRHVQKLIRSILRRILSQRKHAWRFRQQCRQDLKLGGRLAIARDPSPRCHVTPLFQFPRTLSIYRQIDDRLDDDAYFVSPAPPPPPNCVLPYFPWCQIQTCATSPVDGDPDCPTISTLRLLTIRRCTHR